MENYFSQGRASKLILPLRLGQKGETNSSLERKKAVIDMLVPISILLVGFSMSLLLLLPLLLCFIIIIFYRYLIMKPKNEC